MSFLLKGKLACEKQTTYLSTYNQTLSFKNLISWFLRHAAKSHLFIPKPDGDLPSLDKYIPCFDVKDIKESILSNIVRKDTQHTRGTFQS